MSRKFLIIALFVLSTTSCGPKGTDASAPVQTPPPKPTTGESAEPVGPAYRLKGDACETHQRLYSSYEEMCLNLQIEGNNNECALAARQELFLRQCPGQAWDSETSAKKTVVSGGYTVTCFFSEGEPTELDLDAGTKYVIVQKATSDVMTLIHENTRAIVTSSFTKSTKPKGKGKFTLSIELFADKEAKTLLAASKDSWEVGTASKVGIEKTSHPAKPEIHCYAGVLPSKL